MMCDKNFTLLKVKVEKPDRTEEKAERRSGKGEVERQKKKRAHPDDKEMAATKTFLKLKFHVQYSILRISYSQI